MTVDFSEWPLDLFRTMLDHIVTAQCQANPGCQINETLSVRANVRKVARLRLVSKIFDAEITRALVFQLNKSHASPEYNWHRNPRLVVKLLFHHVSRAVHANDFITISIHNVLNSLSERANQSSISLASRDQHGAVLYALCEAMTASHPQPADLVRLACAEDQSEFAPHEVPKRERNDADLGAAAAYLGDIKLMRVLINEGADLDAFSPCFGHPMSAAARAGQEQIIRLLLEQGADRPGRSWGEEAETPLEAAAAGGCDEVVTTFRMDRWAGCVPPQNDFAMKRWRRLVMRVVDGGSVVITDKLLMMAIGSSGNPTGSHWELPFSGWWVDSDKDEDFSIDTLKKEALLEAARTGRREIIEYLLKLGVDIDAKDDKSRTPLLLATGPGFHGCVKLLLDHGASSRKCFMSYSGGALGLAIEKNHMSIVRLLLEGGALDPEWRLPGDGRESLRLRWRGNLCDHGPLAGWMVRRGIWMRWHEVMRLASKVYGLDPDCDCLKRYDEHGVRISGA